MCVACLCNLIETCIEDTEYPEVCYAEEEDEEEF